MPRTTSDEHGDRHGAAGFSLAEVDRRRFLHVSLATAAATLAGCASEPRNEGATELTSTAPPTAVVRPGLDGGGLVDADTMFGWIEEVVSQGIRRPGYPADVWTESFVADQFRAFGLQHVRVEPVPVSKWEPIDWKLVATPSGAPARELACFPLPYSRSAEGVEVELVALETGDLARVAGKAALVEARVLRVPPSAPAAGGSAPRDLTGRIYDPDGTFASGEHVLPHSLNRNRVVDPAIAAGAVAFIGTLIDYPGDGHQYYVPYHGEPLPLPGVWVSGSDGVWLAEQLRRGAVHIQLRVESTSTEVESHNIVGELAGADDEVVMIGSHHDGPWASAVEDGSGIALVLAQAAYWAAQPEADRPHRLRFVLQAGHMCGGAGAEAYVAAHAAELDAVVVEVHLEHAARDVAERDGQLVPTGHCVPRWFFTSRVPRLEAAVASAIEVEDLRRSMLLAPDALGDRPPTDGARYHDAGVPIVHFLTAPWYLFDEADTLDTIDKEHLVALTRAVVRVIESTRGTSAQTMRAELQS